MRKCSAIAGGAFLLAVLAAAFVCMPALRAQNAYGSLVGSVTDSSGAVVPGAAVTLTNLGTTEKKSMQTDASGSYRFVNLLPAQYRVEFEKTGFKRVVQSPVTIQVDATMRLEVALQVGAATETVQVTTQAPLLQTESGTLGSQVEGKTVQEMPLNGRNVMNLISLVPGVVPEGGSMGNTSINQTSHTNSSGWGNYQIGGSIAGQGAMFVDGAPLNGLNGNSVGYIPTQDSVQEFKVGTNSVSAEFGRFGGGVVEMTTKSGSNQYHASVYEYFRNASLNANTWNPTGTITKQKWNQNQYGAAGGGPIVKNKAFFFFSWEKFISRTGNLQSTNIPDTGMMSGTDPSVPGNIITSKVALPASQAGCLNYHDPATGGDGRTHISPSCLDPTAQILKNYFLISTVAPGSNNFIVYVPIGDDNQEFNVRGDLNLTSNQRLFVRYTHFNLSDIPLDTMNLKNLPNGVTRPTKHWNTANSISLFPVNQAVLGDTVTLNQTTILDVRLSYLRTYINDYPPNAGTDISKLGLGANWNAIGAEQNIGELPWVSMSGGTYNMYKFGALTTTHTEWLNHYVLSANLTKIKGAHTLKVGGEVRRMDDNSMPSINPGKLTINNATFAQNEWANFLLGDIANFTFTKVIRTTSYNWYQGYYLTDTWNATRKLTVNAGLRWELPGGLAEKHDRGTVLLPDVTQTINGAPALGVMALLNSSVYPNRTTSPVPHNLFSPRLGLAYRLNDKTVVRSGFALVYMASINGMPSSSPVDAASTTAVNTSNSVANYTVSNPLGVGTTSQVTIVQPSGTSNPNFMTSYANTSPLSTVSAPVPTSKVPYMSQWNLSVAHEFKWQQSIDISYAGANSIHQAMARSNAAGAPNAFGLNQISDANAQVLAACVTAAGSSKTAAAACNATAQAARPHPAYQNLSDSNPANGQMSYNGLQVKYQKRIGTGLLNSSYTWSKMIGDTDTSLGLMDLSLIGLNQNFNDLRTERSILTYSIAHRSVTSYILDLPFGRGKKWANSLNPVLDRVISGWAINGITSLQSGQPLALYQASNALANSYGAGMIRPTAKADCSKVTGGSAQSRLGKWFDTTCYTATGNYAMGNEPRVDSRLHGAGIANWDITTQKTTRIAESTNLAFRVEFFNIFNRRQFFPPGLSISSPGTFGVITTQNNNPRQIQASLRLTF